MCQEGKLVKRKHRPYKNYSKEHPGRRADADTPVIKRSFFAPFDSSADFKHSLIAPLSVPFITLLSASRYVLPALKQLALAVLDVVNLDFHTSQDHLLGAYMYTFTALIMTANAIFECLKTTTMLICRTLSTITHSVKGCIVCKYPGSVNVDYTPAP